MTDTRTWEEIDRAQFEQWKKDNAERLERIERMRQDYIDSITRIANDSRMFTRVEAETPKPKPSVLTDPEDFILSGIGR